MIVRPTFMPRSVKRIVRPPSPGALQVRIAAAAAARHARGDLQRRQRSAVRTSSIAGEPGCGVSVHVPASGLSIRSSVTLPSGR